MDSTLYFDFLKKSEQLEIDFKCVYIHDANCSDAGKFFSALEIAIKSSEVYPDGLVILFTTNRLDSIRQFWNKELERQSLLERLEKNNISYAKSIYFVEIHPNQLKINNDLSSWSPPIILRKEDLAKLFNAGLSNLVSKNNVLHSAPSGHTFKHPSAKRSKLFIQARELASNESEIQFVGRGLSLLNPGIDFKDVEIIYIDSMGIYPFVKEAVIFSESKANIESFHSYSSISDLSPQSENSLVIISASTSGNMARYFARNGFSSDQIITIVDTERRDLLSKVLVNLDLKEDYGIEGDETDIEINGEHFSYKAKPPKEITIGVSHKPSDLHSILKVFGLNGVNPINDKLESINKNPVLSLSPGSLDCKDFDAWLSDEIKWSIPSSINTIIHSDDGASSELASKVKGLLDKTRGSSNKSTILKADDLVDKSCLESSTGIIVVSAFAGDGGSLRQISRDLREFERETSPRHFLIGVGIPQSMESWKRLTQFLVRNATQRTYGFSFWKVLPLGPDSLANSWAKITVLASKSQMLEFDESLGLSEDKFNQSLEAVNNSVKLSNNELLPATDESRLQITSGFVFFGNAIKDEHIENVPQSTVFLTISAVLQTAREHSKTENCLSPSNYQSVVLSPENFLRFNDDVLQACLLRAALASELDYSSDNSLSEIMKELISKMFRRHQYPYGRAALEFAAALATKKLKLKSEHTNQLIDEVINSPDEFHAAIIGFMVLLKKV